MSTKLERGLSIGPYRLDFRLGVGGMGEVWSAFRDDGERVALKLLRADLDPGDYELFADEARTALSLQHPNIVPTWDVGSDADREYYYIAMQLIAGPSVSVLLQSCQKQEVTIAPEVVAFVGSQIAAALHHAHEEATLEGRPLRLVHRDITPHNIMLHPAGRALLTDFGIARTDVQEHRTKTGTIRGKPAYMSPEQVNQEPVDQRTDIFSLGIVLYEMATMRRLFGRGTMIGSIRAVVEEEAPPITSIVPGFPPGLSAVITEMLHKRRARRPSSAAELQVRLESLQAELPGLARAPAVLSAFLHWLYPPGSFDAERISQHEATQSTTTAPDLARAAEGAPPGQDEALTELDRREQTISWPVLDLSGTYDLPPLQPLDLRDILDTKLPEPKPRPEPSPSPPPGPSQALSPRRGRGALIGGGLGMLGAVAAIAWAVMPREPAIPEVPLTTRKQEPPPRTVTHTSSTSTSGSTGDRLDAPPTRP